MSYHPNPDHLESVLARARRAIAKAQSLTQEQQQQEGYNESQAEDHLRAPQSAGHPLHDTTLHRGAWSNASHVAEGGHVVQAGSSSRLSMDSLEQSESNISTGGSTNQQDQLSTDQGDELASTSSASHGVSWESWRSQHGRSTTLSSEADNELLTSAPHSNGEEAVEELDEAGMSPRRFSQPLRLVAERLALLQRQQAHTLQQLLSLRLEQLRLRQQQLSALQELLRSEVSSVEGTPLQLSAVQQAVQLLAQSLQDMQLAAAAIHQTSAIDDVASVAETVSRADSRAEEVSRMARQLLAVLREFPRRQGAEFSHRQRGATELQLQDLPTVTCKEGSSLVGEPCSICLSDFQPADRLTYMQCTHFFHRSCLSEWLRIRACCPLCKIELSWDEGQHPIVSAPNQGASAAAAATTTVGNTADETWPERVRAEATAAVDAALAADQLGSLAVTHHNEGSQAPDVGFDQVSSTATDPNDTIPPAAEPLPNP